MWSVECVYARVQEHTMKATSTTPADRTERPTCPAASSAFGPFTKHSVAEQVVAALSARSDVYSARIVGHVVEPAP